MENPLIKRNKLFSTVVRIPSRGIVYENGELDPSVTDGELEIRPMTGRDEILIRNPSLLLNGKAIEEVFEHCIPQVKKPLDIVLRDFDYLLVALRSISYGPEIEVEHVHCKDKKHKYVFNLDELLSEIKHLDPVSFEEKRKVKIQDEFVVCLNLVSVGSILKILTTPDDADNEEDLEEVVETSFKNLLQSISYVKIEDGAENTIITDKDMIFEWLKTLTTKDLKKLVEGVTQLNEMEWGIPQTFKTKCKQCKKDIEIEVPLNPISFFS
jgi:hypothetical protein